jgi:hypothetical protein
VTLAVAAAMFAVAAATFAPRVRRSHGRRTLAAMSMVGDVVFCVDCDRARSAHVDASGSAPPIDAQYPRRGATKKDANGDALCAACLDARLLQRRAAFVRQQSQSLPEPAPAVSARQPTTQPVRNLSQVRIVRVRPVAETVQRSGNQKPAHTKVSQAAAARSTAHRVVAKTQAHRLERAFLEVAAGIGLLRSRELLDELRTRAYAILAVGEP